MQVRHHLAYGTFQDMSVRVAALENGILALECIAESTLASVVLELNFATERLSLNPVAHILINDDGSYAGKVGEMDAYKLETDLFLNGVLEVWNADTGDSLGRSAPFLPVNMRYNHEGSQRTKKKLAIQLIERSAK